jgi:hypothetical protein
MGPGPRARHRGCVMEGGSLYERASPAASRTKGAWARRPWRMHPGSAVRPGACFADGSRMQDGCTMCPRWIQQTWMAGASEARAGCTRRGHVVHAAGTMGARRRLRRRAHHGLTVHEDGQVRSPVRGVPHMKEPWRVRPPRDDRARRRVRRWHPRGTCVPERTWVDARTDHGAWPEAES